MPTVNRHNLDYYFSFGAVLKGILITIVASLLLSFMVGATYYFTSITEHSLPWSTAAILAASSFGGALFAGREAGNKGLYHGLLVGLVFFLIVWLVAGLFLPGQIMLGTLYKLLIIMAAGGVGGIIGVGLS